MTLRRILLLTLASLALLAIPPPSPAGTIRYEFDDVNWPHSGIGTMSVDDSALTRGYFDNADLRGFSFPPIDAAGLSPFRLTIASDGTPTGQGTIAGRELVGGSTYSLRLDWGPGAEFYQITAPGSHGIFGYGTWTTILAQGGPPGVPEPPSVMMGLVGIAFVVLAKGVRR